MDPNWGQMQQFDATSVLQTGGWAALAAAGGPGQIQRNDMNMGSLLAPQMHTLPTLTDTGLGHYSVARPQVEHSAQQGQAYSTAAALGLGLGGGGNMQLGARDALSVASLAGLGSVRGSGQLLSPLSPSSGILAPRAQAVFPSQHPHGQPMQQQDLAGKKTLQENDALSFLSEVPCPESLAPEPTHARFFVE